MFAYGFASPNDYNEVFRKAVDGSLEGFTFGELPGRYTVSERGEVTVPHNLIVHEHGRWHWDGAFQVVALRALNREGFAPGVWMNEGTAYFDVSTSFDDKDKACQFALDNEQRAIYDRVGRDGKHYIDPETGEYI